MIIYQKNQAIAFSHASAVQLLAFYILLKIVQLTFQNHFAIVFRMSFITWISESLRAKYVDYKYAQILLEVCEQKIACVWGLYKHI